MHSVLVERESFWWMEKVSHELTFNVGRRQSFLRFEDTRENIFSRVHLRLNGEIFKRNSLKEMFISSVIVSVLRWRNLEKLCRHRSNCRLYAKLLREIDYQAFVFCLILGSDLSKFEWQKLESAETIQVFQPSEYSGDYQVNFIFNF